MATPQGRKRKTLISPSIERTSSHTRSKWIHFSHRWTVDEFVTRCSMNPVSDEIISSPIFSPSLNESIKFYLKLYPWYHEEPNYTAIFLHFSSLSKVTRVITKYRMSLIDCNGYYCETAKGGARPFDRGDCWGFPQFLNRSFLLRNAKDCLPGDQLTVLCEVSCLIDYEEKTTDAINQAIITCLDQAKQDYSNLFSTGLHSDVQLYVNGTEFRVHKCILSIRSSVFAALFKQPKSQRIDLTIDVNCEVFESMLIYIYSGKVNEAVDKYITELLALADLYELNHLKQFCEQSLCSKLSFSTAVDLLNLAHSHKALILKCKAIEYIKENLYTIKETSNWRMFEINQPELFDELAGMWNLKAKRPKYYIKKEQVSFD